METTAVNRNEAPAEALKQAVDILRSSLLIVAPTETSYMLGAVATDAQAVARLIVVKGRRPDKPLPVIVGDLAMARHWGVLGSTGERLAAKFWPGPLTMLVPQARAGLHLGAPSVADVALRVPGARLIRELSGLVGAPLISTSANASGGNEPYSVEDVRRQLGLPRPEVGLVLDGGGLARVPPSTIVDLRGEPPRVLREGAIATSQLWD